MISTELDLKKFMTLESLSNTMTSISKESWKLEYLRFLHLSDFHFPMIKFQDGISIDKEKGYHSPYISILNEVYKIIDDVDFILISGDFTRGSTTNPDSCIRGFEECLSFICKKFAHHNAKIFSVFGNHDLDRGYGNKKFDRFLQVAKNYQSIDFGKFDVCELRKIAKIGFPNVEIDLLLINTCKKCSDYPIIPKNLEHCITRPISKLYEKEINSKELTANIWSQIKAEIEKSTLIDGFHFDVDDYEKLCTMLNELGPVVCLSHYNLVSFSGIDMLSSFFRDQGKFRDIFVNHRDTVIYLNGHTHTQECTVIENPNDCTNKLVCITAPPLFRIESSRLNGFNLIDIIMRVNDSGFCEPIGCKIKFIGINEANESITECKKIRFSKNIAKISFSNREHQVISALKKATKEISKVRLKEILDIINDGNTSHEEYSEEEIHELHEILMYLWWIGVIDDYSAMKRENDFEAKIMDNVGGILCVPIRH